MGESKPELDLKTDSEEEARVESEIDKLEDVVTYFPEYQSLNAFEMAVSSRQAHQPRQTAQSQDPPKDFCLVPEPPEIQLTIIPQPAINIVALPICWSLSVELRNCSTATIKAEGWRGICGMESPS